MKVDMPLNKETKSYFGNCASTDLYVWFLLFNGISTFVGYFMPYPSFKKNSSGAI